jgi:hypothetical protein
MAFSKLFAGRFCFIGLPSSNFQSIRPCARKNVHQICGGGAGLMAAVFFRFASARLNQAGAALSNQLK